MKILKTKKYIKLQKKAQMEGQEGQTVDLYARYVGDGYLSAAEYVSEIPDNMGDKYWADYYDSDQDPNETETVLLENVPLDIAQKLVLQGTSNQWYDDGYEAAKFAAPYVERGSDVDDEPISSNFNNYPPDTPMGMEDDNPIEEAGY